MTIAILFLAFKGGVGKSDVGLLEPFILASALPVEEADPVLVAHLCDHPCLAFESLLISVLAMLATTFRAAQSVSLLVCCLIRFSMARG